MINILHLIESSETGGAEHIFMKILSNIDNKMYRSFAGLLYNGWLYDELRKINIEPTIFRTSGSFDLGLIKKMVCYIKYNNINIIHSHLFGMNLYACIVGMLCNIPVISTFHGLVDVKSTDKLINFKFLIINIISSNVIYVSDSLYNNYRSKYYTNSSKSKVIYNGINIDIFNNINSQCLRKEFNFKIDDFIVGCIGDIRPIKGYDTLLESAKILTNNYKNIRFLIVGSQTGSGQDFNYKIRKYGLADIVKYIGYRNDVNNILKTIDIYVLPSISEGFSLSTIEAMAAGKPVIATRCGGPEEIITDSYDGLLVNVNDPEAISKAVEILMNDSNKRLMFTNNAKKNVIQRFSLDVMINKYMDIYGDALKIHNR